MYEIHITCYTSQGTKAAEVASEMSWKTSEIARDPVLGNDTYYYLTTHAKSFDTAIDRMILCVDALKEAGVIVIREKIEHIIHDVRFKLK